MDVGLHGWGSTPRYSRSLYQRYTVHEGLLYFKSTFLFGVSLYCGPRKVTKLERLDSSYKLFFYPPFGPFLFSFEQNKIQTQNTLRYPTPSVAPLQMNQTRNEKKNPRKKKN